MITKTEKAINLIKQGKNKEALKIIRKFDRVYTKEEMRVLDIAYECLAGSSSFYLKLGIDVESIKNQAIVLFNKIIKNK